MEGTLYVQKIQDIDVTSININEKERRDYNITTKLNYNLKNDELIEFDKKFQEQIYHEMKNNRRLDNVFNISDFRNDIRNGFVYDKIEYYPCVINLLDLEEKSETIDNLLFHFKMDEQFGSIFKFDTELMSVESEVELKVWIFSSMQIHETIEHYSFANNEMEKLLLSLPKQTFKFSISQHANCYLEDCKIMKRLDRDKFLVLVDRIVFYT